MAFAKSFAKAIGYGLIAIVALPIYLAFMAIFMSLWLVFTVTAIGPIAQYVCKKSDDKLLAKSPVTYIVVHETAGSRRLAIRWTKGISSLPPVCIPNGLGATLISISRLHELLVDMGFSVMSYDRAGVGMSDPLPNGTHHFGAEATIEDMHCVLTHSDLGLPSGTKWILIGPSMGSIVAQCYIAAHPEQVCGFLNHDGFPFPFAAKRGRFEKAAMVYSMYTKIVWTGVLRPFLYLASGTFTKIASRDFSVAAVRAQMNQANFFCSLAREMVTMMDCADYARTAWGPGFDFQTMTPEQLLPLINSRPAACGDVATAPGSTGTKPLESEGTGLLQTGTWWVDLPRSKWEKGTDWAPEEDTRAAIARMEHSNSDDSNAPLRAAFSTLVVRCMTSRDYSFPGGESFYDAQMKDWSAAEHSLHAYAAADGARTVFPTHHHGNLFFNTVEYAAQLTMEIAEGVAKRQRKAAPV